MRRAEPWIVAVAASAFLDLLFFRDGAFVYGRNPFAGTFIFDEPARVARGEIMYRDFFEFLGPGLVYLHAVVIGVFGPRIAPLGWLFVLVGAGLACTVHRLTALVVPSRLRLLAPAAFVTLVYARNEMGDHKWPALLCGMLGLLTLTGAPTRGRAVAGGALLGAGTLFSQDFGAAIVSGAVVWMAAARDQRRRLPAVLAGSALAIALPMSYFLVSAGARSVFYDVVIFPVTRYPTIMRHYVQVRPRDVPGWACLTLGLGGLTAGLLALRPPRALFGELSPERRRVLGAAGCAGVALIVPGIHRGLDVTGQAWQVILIAPLCALLDGARASRLAVTRLAATAAIGVVVLGASWNTAAMVSDVQAGSRWTRQRHRGGDVWFDTPRPELSWLEAQAAVGEAVFFIPAFGAYEFLSHTRNVTSYPALIDHHTPGQVAQALDEIAARRPRAGLFNPGPRGPVSRPHVFFPPIEARLRERYDFEVLPSGVCLLRLQPEKR